MRMALEKEGNEMKKILVGDTGSSSADGAGADVVVEPELALREEIEDAFLQVYFFRAFLLLLSD